MTFTPALILDIALIGVVVATVIHYARKGFVAGLIDVVGNLAAIALAWFVSGKVSPTVFENFFKSGLVEKTTQTLQQGSFSLESVLGGLEGLVPQSLMDSIMESANSVLNSQAPDLAQQVVEQIISPLVVPLITVVLFFATFLLCRVVIAFLVAVLTNLNKVPLLGGVNRTLGVVVGLVGGVLNALLLLCLIWAVIVITSNNLPVVNDSALSGSYFYSFFSAYNPFMSA